MSAIAEILTRKAEELTKKEMVKEWAYQTPEAMLIPYLSSTPNTLGPDFLMRLYAKTETQHLTRRVFPGIQPMDLVRFVNYVGARPILVGLVKENNQVAGYGWLYEIEGVDYFRKASFGFCFFKEYWRTKVIREMARLALKWWFTECKITILYGATLHENRSAMAFSREFGFNFVGTLPKFFFSNGKLLDADLVYLTKLEFDNMGLNSGFSHLQSRT